VLPIQAECLFSHFWETKNGTPRHLLLIIYGQIIVLFVVQSKCALKLPCFVLFSWFTFCMHFLFHPCIIQFILGFHLIGYKLYDIALSEIDKDTAKQDLKFSRWFSWGLGFSGMWCCVAWCLVSVSGAQGFIYFLFIHSMGPNKAK
jgi:hypothetical protein